MNPLAWWRNQTQNGRDFLTVIGGIVLAALVAAALAVTSGCTPATLTVRLDRVPGGERATISLDGEPAVALSSATTLTVEEL